MVYFLRNLENPSPNLSPTRQIISYDSHSYCTPPPTPPRLRGGETKHSFGSLGFFEFNKQLSGHDIRSFSPSRERLSHHAVDG